MAKLIQKLHSPRGLIPAQTEVKCRRTVQRHWQKLKIRFFGTSQTRFARAGPFRSGGPAEADPALAGSAGKTCTEHSPSRAPGANVPCRSSLPTPQEPDRLL